MANEGPTAKSSSMFDEQPWVLFRMSPRLEELRLFYDQGVMPALYDALMLVKDSGCPAPEWVIDGALRAVGDRLKLGFPTGKGASGNELARYRNDMKHFRRWQAVMLLLQEGISSMDVFDEAANRLKGNFAHAGEDAVKKSFQRVKKDLQNPKRRLRYYRAMREVQELTDTATPSVKDKS